MANSKRISATILKARPEKRLVTAWLSQSEDAEGRPVVDDDGDTITIDVLEDAIIKAFAAGGAGKVERQHTSFGLGDVVQAFTVSHDERMALGFGPGPSGAIVKLRITDDDLWRDIKSGAVNDLSFIGLVEVDE